MYHVRGPHPVLKLGHKKCLFMQFYFYLTKSDQNQIIVHKKSGCGPKSYKRDLTLCDLYILPYDLSVIMYPGVNILHYFQIKYLGKVFLFLVFWGRVSSCWQMFLKLFENSNEICELSCRLYGLRVTFWEEFVCSLWEKFPWFS